MLGVPFARAQGAPSGPGLRDSRRRPAALSRLRLLWYTPAGEAPPLAGLGLLLMRPAASVSVHTCRTFQAPDVQGQPVVAYLGYRYAAERLD